MRRLAAVMAALLITCVIFDAGLAAVPTVNLSVMSESDLNQLKSDITSERKLHHETDSKTKDAVKKAAESVAEDYYRQKGISISWAWHGWEYDYKRDKDFFTFATHLDYKDSNDKNHQVKVAADLIWDGKQFRVYHLYLDQKLVMSDESGIPTDHLIDVSNVVINEKTGINLSLLSADELKELENRVRKELDMNHTVQNSGKVHEALKKTVEGIYAEKGVKKVEWPWFDYTYTCHWNCYTEKTRITFDLNGEKNRNVPVYAELFPEGKDYAVCYLKIGDWVVMDNLKQVNSTEGKLFLNNRKYEEAKRLMSEGQYGKAAALFDELGGYDDSAVLKQKCLEARKPADHSASDIQEDHGTSNTPADHSTSGTQEDHSVSGTPAETERPVTEVPVNHDQNDASDDREEATVKTTEAPDPSNVFYDAPYLKGRGLIDTAGTEPDYVNTIGYAAVYMDAALENNAEYAVTPWTVPVLHRVDGKWEQDGTIDHKTRIGILSQELIKQNGKEYQGYLEFQDLETGRTGFINVRNFVTSPYWDQNLTNAAEKGYGIAVFAQKSKYVPVYKDGRPASLKKDTKVLLPARGTYYVSIMDRINYQIPGIVFENKNNKAEPQFVFFNKKDLTLIY